MDTENEKHSAIVDKPLTARSLTSDSSDNDKNAPIQESVEEDQYPHGLKLVLLSSATLVAVFLIALDQTIVGTAIPKITDEFGGLEDVSWYAAAYFMTFGGAQTSAGKIYKYYNLKWGFVVSMIIFEIGSLLCGAAPNSKTLVVGRAIAGLGASGLSVGGTSIISFTVPPVQRPLMMGFVGMTYAISAVLGPLLGGAFTESVSWRWCFYINLPVGGAAAIAVILFFNLPAAATPPDLPWKKKLLHLDPVGVALAMGSLTCFILAMQYAGHTHPWGSSTVVGLLVGFVAIAAALIGWEIWLGEYAMMLPRLYKQRTLSVTAVYQFFFMGSYIVLLFYLPIYFQSILGTSPIRSGVNNLPLVVPAAVFALAGGAVVMITGRPQQVMFIGSMLTTVAIGLICTFDIGTPTAKWVGYQVFVGCTMAFAIMHGLAIAQAYVGPEDLSAVTANLLFFQTVGGAFSTSAGQAAFVNQLIAKLPTTAPGIDPSMVIATGASELRNVFPPDVLPGVIEAYMTGLTAAFAVSVAFSGVAFVSTLGIPMRKLPSHEGTEKPMAIG